MTNRVNAPAIRGIALDRNGNLWLYGENKKAVFPLHQAVETAPMDDDDNFHSPSCRWQTRPAPAGLRTVPTFFQFRDFFPPLSRPPFSSDSFQAEARDADTNHKDPCYY
jgi:hypothetical protein